MRVSCRFLGRTAAVLLVCAAASRTGLDADRAAAKPPRVAAPSRVEAYGKVPLGFEPCLEVNCGGDAGAAGFIARGRGYGVRLAPTTAVVSLQDRKGAPATVRMRLRRANTRSKTSALEPLAGKSNYFI